MTSNDPRDARDVTERIADALRGDEDEDNLPQRISRWLSLPSLDAESDVAFSADMLGEAESDLIALYRLLRDAAARIDADAARIAALAAERTERDKALSEGVWLQLQIDADGTYILSDPLTLQYGAGATADVAFDEYLASLEEYAALLQQEGQPDIVAEFWRQARENGSSDDDAR